MDAVIVIVIIIVIVDFLGNAYGRIRRTTKCIRPFLPTGVPPAHDTILYYYYTILILHTILYYTMLCYAMLCYTILYYTILYYAMLCYAILYYAILHYTILYCTILYYTTLYYTILHYTILYYTILYLIYYTIHQGLVSQQGCVGSGFSVLRILSSVTDGTGTPDPNPKHLVYLCVLISFS